VIDVWVHEAANTGVEAAHIGQAALAYLIDGGQVVDEFSVDEDVHLEGLDLDYLALG
jgi:hypothetical protein